MRLAGGDVLAFASTDAGGFFTHSRSFRGPAPDQCGAVRGSFIARLNSSLLAGDGFGRSLAGPGVGMGTLPAHRQATAVPQPPIAPKVHQALDIHRHFAPQIALDHVVTIDDFANLQHLLVGQLGYPTLVRNPDFLHDFAGLFRPDAMDVLECDDHAFVSGYVDTGDARHGPNSSCRRGNLPADADRLGSSKR